MGTRYSVDPLGSKPTLVEDASPEVLLCSLYAPTGSGLCVPVLALCLEILSLRPAASSLNFKQAKPLPWAFHGCSELGPVLIRVCASHASLRIDLCHFVPQIISSGVN